MTALLRLERVSAFYGAVQALRSVDVHIDRGEIVALIGANGAGKSTLMMTICGHPRAREGRVLHDGDDITALPTHAIMRRGIAHAPEGRRVFPRMTIDENLALGAARTPPADAARTRDAMFALFPRLAERRSQRAGLLSGGEQQMLAIARALMSRPALLLLDEPSLGLAPLVTRAIFAAIAALNRDTGLTILLVEQNAHAALRLAHRGYVLANGSVTATGPAAALLARPDIGDAYLGAAARADQPAPTAA